MNVTDYQSSAHEKKAIRAITMMIPNTRKKIFQKEIG